MLEILLLVAFVLLPLVQQYLSRREEASQPSGSRPAPRAPVPAPSPDVPAAAPRRAERRDLSALAAIGEPVPAAMPELVARRGARNRPRGWRLSESDARRAIVLTTVFGPCRALRPYGQEPG